MNASSSPPDAEYERVAIADLAHYHRNPRVGNVPLIVESLAAHGQYKPMIVNRGSKTGRPNEVLAGNHMLKAMRELGWRLADVRWLDVDEETAQRIVLIDNRSSDKGTYDEEALAQLLVDLPSLDATGYSEADLRKLLNGLEAGDQDGLTDPDDAPDKVDPSRAKTKPGDVWLLGKHRLVCGDATRMEAVALAAGGEVMDAMWTDPPYGVEYTGGTAEALTILNDDKAGLPALLRSAFLAAIAQLKEGAPFYVAHADTERVTFELALIAAGFRPRQNLIWVKNKLVLGRSDYQWRHEPIIEGEVPTDEEVAAAQKAAAKAAEEANVSRETSGDDAPVEEVADELLHDPILYGFTPATKKGRLGRGGDRWFGGNKQTTVFEFPKPQRSSEHPTIKPVDLVAAHLRNHLERGMHVLDVFAGSGTTLIAAHRLSLIAHLVELDPGYCDVICRRWQEHTGEMPVLERTGKGVSFLKKAA